MLQTFLANWRRRRRGHRELKQLSTQEFTLLARDIGVSDDILERLLSCEDRSEQLEKMLAAVGLDPRVVRERHPEVLVDMTVACMQCIMLRACRRAHARGEAAERYHEFCPNAPTIESLLVSAAAQPPGAKPPARRH